jgi:hypothetical protein
VVPGCSYPQGDVALFTKFGQIVGQATLSPTEAQRLAIDIERACDVGEENQAFETLVSRLSSLAPIRAMLSTQPQLQRKALLMLATALNASALTRRSGTMPTVVAAGADGPSQKR